MHLNGVKRIFFIMLITATALRDFSSVKAGDGEKCPQM